MYKIKPDSVLHLDLPWPPTINHYWGERVVKGRITRYIGPKGLVFRAKTVDATREHLKHAQQHFGKGTRLAVCIHIYPPDRRRRDIDNLAKATLDALENAGIYPDDEQIDSLTLIRDKDAIVKGGAITVIIGTCDGVAVQEFNAEEYPSKL